MKAPPSNLRQKKVVLVVLHSQNMFFMDPYNIRKKRTLNENRKIWF